MRKNSNPIRTLLTAAALLAAMGAHASTPEPAGDGQRLVAALPFAGALQQQPAAVQPMVTIAPQDPPLEVPEPATAALVAVALGAMVLLRRRR